MGLQASMPLEESIALNLTNKADQTTGESMTENTAIIKIIG